MATAIILRTLLAFFAVQQSCRGHADETCGQAASPGTERRNNSFQYGVSIEDDLPDNQVGLLQVELHIDSVTKDHYLHAQQAKKLGKGVSKAEYLQNAKIAAAGASIFFVLGLVCIGGIMACMLLEVFSDNALEDEYKNAQKGYSPQQLQRIGPYQSAQEAPRKGTSVASPVASDVAPSSPGPSPTAPTFGWVAGVAAATGYLEGTGPVHTGYAQPSAQNNAGQYVSAAAVSSDTGYAQQSAQNNASASRSPRPAPAPMPSMGHSPRSTSPRTPVAVPGNPSPRGPATPPYQETPGVGSVAPDHALMMSQQMRTTGSSASPRQGPPQSLPYGVGTVAPDHALMMSQQIPTPGSSASPRQGPPQSQPYGLASSHADGPSTPRGRSAVAGQRGPQSREVFVGAGTPAIASTMIMLNTPVFLTIPMSEMSGVVQEGRLEKLVVFSSKGKPMLSGKVEAKDGDTALLFSSVGGDLPRVYIKPRGRGSGEPLDVLDPRGEHYGTLTHSGGSLAILSNQGNQPIMKINKVADRSMLEMQAITMNGKPIAHASPEGANWKLTVGPGVDGVLICACMVGTSFFWRE